MTIISAFFYLVIYFSVCAFSLISGIAALSLCLHTDRRVYEALLPKLWGFLLVLVVSFVLLRFL